MTNLYKLYYNKDWKNAIATETKEYFNRLVKKTYHYETITTADAVITYHSNENNEIVNRFVD